MKYRVPRRIYALLVLCGAGVLPGGCMPRTGTVIKNGREGLDIEYYERVRSDQAEALQQALNERYPKGSDAVEAKDYVENGGIKCQFGYDKEYFYFCLYTRPGHGLMALVSTIEWRIIIYTDKSGKKVDRIATGRGATGL